MKNYYHFSPSQDGWTNLATDQWLLDNLEDDDFVLHLFVQEKAVVYGKELDPAQVCRLDAIAEDGVQLMQGIAKSKTNFYHNGMLNLSFIAGKNRQGVEPIIKTLVRALQGLDITCVNEEEHGLQIDGQPFYSVRRMSNGNTTLYHGCVSVQPSAIPAATYLVQEPDPVTCLCQFKPSITVPLFAAALRQSFRKVYGDYSDWAPSVIEQRQVTAYRNQLKQQFAMNDER